LRIHGNGFPLLPTTQATTSGGIDIIGLSTKTIESVQLVYGFGSLAKLSRINNIGKRIYG
jgi:hypothetical protein